MAAPYLVFYESDDVTPTPAISASKNAGDTIAPVTRHLWNDLGGSHSSTTAKNIRLVAEAFDGVNWVREGEPCLDEGWLQASLVGQNKTGDATMEDQTSAYIALGSNRALLLKDIPKNCARFVSTQIVIPAGTSTQSPSMRLIAIYDETSTPLGLLTSLATGGGILSDWRDSSTRRLSGGRTLSAASTDVLTIAKGRYSYEGQLYFRIQEALTLNQTANDGALTAGQSYIAVISQPQNSAAIATKGNRGASPTAPATPAGNIFLGKVTVSYQAGGQSIITNANIDTTGVVFGDYNVSAGAGLTVVVGAGKAITSADTEIFSTAASTLAVTNNAVNNVWVLTDGTFVVTNYSVVGSASPAIGAQLLAQVNVSGGAVIGITDMRYPAGRLPNEYSMTLQYLGELSLVTDAAWSVLPIDAILDSYEVNLGVHGAIGGVKLDVLYRSPSISLATAGTTIFTSFATSDMRPRLSQSIGAEVMRLIGSDHEVIAFDAGTRFSFSIVEIPSAGPATDVVLTLHFRPR
jgi:hypothetical protein